MTAAPAFTILCDTREQAPLDFSGWTVQPTTLAAGDYSIAGLVDHIAIERKELGDLLGCVTHDRDRFKRELQRLRAYRFRAVVIEATLQDIIQERYRSKVVPAAVIGSITKWAAEYEIAFFLAGDRAGAQAVTLAYLRAAWACLSQLAAVFATPASTNACNPCRCASAAASDNTATPTPDGAAHQTHPRHQTGELRP